MNWSRAKTILIIMFLCTAIFQANVLYSTNKQNKKVSPEILNSSVQILSENDIDLSIDIIPEKLPDIPHIDAVNAVSDYREFAEIILGKNLTKISDNEYKSEIGSITYSGNSFKASLSVPEYADISSSANTVDTANTLLKKLGIDIQTAECDIKSTNGMYVLKYQNVPENIPIFNSELTLEISNKGIILDGNWFNITKKTGSVNLKNITAVLIDLIKEEIEKPTKITNISLGYLVPESDQFQKSATLVPVWQILFKNGSIIRIDARNPQ